MNFNDTDGNRYYTEKDRLYVSIAKSKLCRYIGNLTYNFNTKYCNLIIQRTKSQIPQFGVMVSSGPFYAFKIDKLVLIRKDASGEESAFYIDWKKLGDSWKHWSFKPLEIYEEQIVIPNNLWQKITESH